MKYKSRLLKILKIGMLVAICMVIYSQANFVIKEWKINNLRWSEINLTMLLWASAGFFLNIFLECIKWRQLSGRIEKLSYRRTLGSVLSGTALSIITPQRLGDLAGRLVGFNTINFPGLIAVQLLGGMIQIAVVLFMGGISLIMLNIYHDWFLYNTYANISFFVFFILLVLLNIGIFKTRWTIALSERIPLKGKLKKWIESIHVINSFSSRGKAFLYLLTLLRYLVYTSQLLLLIEFLGQPALNWLNLGAVYLLFFIQAGVPLPPLFSLVVRGSIALQVWTLIGDPGFRPLIASYLLWLMNLGIPALIGAFNLIYYKKENND